MKESCTVFNKSSGTVIYRVSDGNIRRQFDPGKRKEIAVRELEKLMQEPGGPELFYNYLYIDDKEVVNYLLNGDEPALEYWLKEAEIPSWMTKCSLAEFQDALDFAPEGTKDLIKSYAVSMPLNDFAKRQAIYDQLGYDVTKAIENKGEEAAAVAEKPVRRVDGGRRVIKTAE